MFLNNFKKRFTILSELIKQIKKKQVLLFALYPLICTFAIIIRDKYY